MRKPLVIIILTMMLSLVFNLPAPLFESRASVSYTELATQGGNSVSINDASVIEGHSGTVNMVFTVTLTASGEHPTIGVRYTTANGSPPTGATAPSDYTSTTNDLIFPPGAGGATMTLAISINGDTAVEPDETFFVNLSVIDSPATVADGQGVGTIINDDGGCNYSINPTSENYTAAGGSGNVSVTAPANCAWTATHNLSWITITSGASGTGNGTVVYSVAQNPGAARTGTLTIAGQTFTVNQTAGSLPALSINNVSVVEGNSGFLNARFTVTLLSSSNHDIVTVNYFTTDGPLPTGAVAPFDYTSTSGTLTFPAGGPGNLTQTLVVPVRGETLIEPDEIFFVDITTSTPEVIVVGGQGTGTIVNDDVSNGCTYSISPTSATMAFGGGLGSVEVVTADGCNWTAVANINWLTITSGASGSGDGTVNYTVAANPNTSPRTGTLTIAGQTFTVTQAAFQAGCSYSISPTQQSFGPDGGFGRLDITAAATCSWLAVSNVNWLTITVGATGTGSGALSYMVAPNSGAARTGTISVAGQTFTINQVTTCNYAIAPASHNFPSNGGIRTFTVTSLPGCLWTATTTENWLRLSTYLNTSGNGGVDVTAAANPGAARTGTISVAGQTFTVTQDAVGTPSLPVVSLDPRRGLTIVERNTGSSLGEFTVVLSEPSATLVTIDYATADLDATVADNDYVSASGTLTFPPGTTTQTISVEIRGDDFAECNELFIVGLSNPVNATIGARSVFCTILNDDQLPLFSIQDIEMIEGDSGTQEAVFVVTLTFPLHAQSALEYRTRDGSAQQGAFSKDYDDRHGFLIFPPGSTAQEIRVTVNGDVQQEPDETFFVELESRCLSFINDRGGCTIRNDDLTPPMISITGVSVPEGSPQSPGVMRIPVTLTSPVARNFPVTLNYQTQEEHFCSGAIARDGIDYIAQVGRITFPPGPAGTFHETITVQLVGDSLPEPNKGFNLHLYDIVGANPIGIIVCCTILDEDARTCAPTLPKPFANKICTPIPFNHSAIVNKLKIQTGVTFDNPSDKITATLTSPSGVVRTISDFRPDRACDGIFEVDFAGENAQGDWFLCLDGGPGTLLCACLDIAVADDRCAIFTEPGAQVFTPHLVVATVMDENYLPVFGATVTFNISDEQNTMPLHLTAVTDAHGRASISYTRGIELKDEVRATVQGLTGFAQINWRRPEICPMEETMKTVDDGGATLELSRQFREQVLRRSERGRSYIETYYRFSPEALRVMLFNPLLALRSREIITRYKPVIEALLAGEPVTLTAGDLDEIDNFLNRFAAKGSAEMQRAIQQVCEDLRDPQVHSEFHIIVTEGAKRELPTGESLQFIEQNRQLLPPFGLFWLVYGFNSRRRRKLKLALRRLLGALLMVSLLGCQWFVVSGKTRVRNTRVGDTRVCDASLTSTPSTENRLTPAMPLDGKLPLRFESAEEETRAPGTFIARGADSNLRLTATDATFQWRGRLKPPVGYGLGKNITIDHCSKPPFLNPVIHKRLKPPAQPVVLRMKISGANPNAKVQGLEKQPTQSNYLFGQDPTKWRVGVANFAKVRFEEVYQGIDLLYYGHQGELEYDFKLAPGANPAAIRLSFDGADRLEINSQGDLALQVAGGEVRHRKPVAYQEVNGERHAVACRYRLIENPKSKFQNSEVAFAVGDYDATRPLVIDPVVVFSTYLGAGGDDQGNSIAVDASGNVYLAGFTDSLNLPTAKAAQPDFGGGSTDAFVMKLNPSGTALLYATYFGGNGQDNASSIAVDAAGNAYITGFTGSANFPVREALQASRRGSVNAFVMKLNAAGALLYSTHLGGNLSDAASSIAVDAANNIYIAGVATSADFPMMNAVQSAFGGAADAFVAKLNAQGNQLLFSTFLGAGGNDGVTSLALDQSGNIYFTGLTTSPNLQTVNAPQRNHGGGLFDAFVAKLNATNGSLGFLTYLGGRGEDRAFRIAVDSAGNAYVAGDTDSSNFPTVNALQKTPGGSADAFIAKLTALGALLYATYLGGNDIDGATALSVNSTGEVYVTGFTASKNFPTINHLQPENASGSADAFVAKLNAQGNQLLFSTYLGGAGLDAGFGVAVDMAGNLYVMGQTASLNFPTTNPWQGDFAGGASDLFIARLTSAPQLSAATTEGKNLIISGTGFDMGATLLVNGEAQKTSNALENPTGRLIGKKVVKQIERGQTVTLQVRNSDGNLSNEFKYTR